MLAIALTNDSMMVMVEEKEDGSDTAAVVRPCPTQSRQKKAINENEGRVQKGSRWEVLGASASEATELRDSSWNDFFLFFLASANSMNGKCA